MRIDIARIPPVLSPKRMSILLHSGEKDMTRAEVINILRQQGQRGTDSEVIDYLLAQLARLSLAVETDSPKPEARPKDL